MKKLDKLDRLERKLEKIELERFRDEKTKKFKLKERKFTSLSRASKKKPDYVLVQYLRNNRTVDFYLSRVVSGNIIIVNNKGHEINPKNTWMRGKNVWYIIREKDTKPVSVIDKPLGHSTDDHPVLIKMVLGAVQKKEIAKDTKKMAAIIIALAVIGLVGWIIFGG